MSTQQTCQVTSQQQRAPITIRYWVHWGYRYEGGMPFDNFAEALDCYRKHRDEPDGAVLHGIGVDGDCDGDGFYQCSDGLTDEERDQLE